ncbi:hypothetical protein [Marinicella sp. W31]|uniref:hypothetical protein n=1 Tax=Marinicella sp. W31 TaxID=3023713 RepID=UPI003756CBBE
MKTYVFINVYIFLTLVLSSQNALAASASVDLTFENGESQQFDAVVCRTDEHQVGNLVVKASVSAQGEINNQKVVLFIDQSHPVGAPTQLFEDLQIWSTEISTEDLVNNDKNYLSRNLDTDLKEWYQKEQVAIQTNLKVTNEMSPEEMIEMTNKSSEALDALHKELKAKQTKMVRSFGKTSVAGNTISFDSGPAGLEMFTRGEPVSFAGLLGSKFSAKVTCAQ